MNKGVSSLVDNWGDWKKELTKTDKLTQDYAEAVVDCTAAIADLVGASSDLELPDEFFNAENMALIERAMQGDINAINALGAAVAEVTVKGLEFNAAFADLIDDTWLQEGLSVDITLDST
jgi:membrane protease subunit (stomatin/prohibitin family)